MFKLGLALLNDAMAVAIGVRKLEFKETWGFAPTRGLAPTPRSNQQGDRAPLPSFNLRTHGQQ